MSDILEFLGNVSTLSTTGVFGAVFSLLNTAGGWAEAVSKVLGLA